MSGDRHSAINRSLDYIEGGDFESELSRRVAYRTESQLQGNVEILSSYLHDEIIPAFKSIEFRSTVLAVTDTETLRTVRTVRGIKAKVHGVCAGTVIDFTAAVQQTTKHNTQLTSPRFEVYWRSAADLDLTRGSS